jgi:hypothetical protein
MAYIKIPLTEYLTFWENQRKANRILVSQIALQLKTEKKTEIDKLKFILKETKDENHQLQTINKDFGNGIANLLEIISKLERKIKIMEKESL